MFKAVGEKYWPVFFREMKDCLRPGGTAGLQIITIWASWEKIVPLGFDDRF